MATYWTSRTRSRSTKDKHETKNVLELAKGSVVSDQDILEVSGDERTD